MKPLPDEKEQKEIIKAIEKAEQKQDLIRRGAIFKLFKDSPPSHDRTQVPV